MKKLCVLCAGTALGLAAQSHAGLLYSFETGLQGWYNPGWSGGDVTFTQDTIGATHGSNSARVDWPAGAGFRWLMTDGISDLVKLDISTATKLMIDVTVPTGFPSTWFNGKAFYNRADGGWFESPEIQYHTSGTATITFNITNLANNVDLSQWARLGFAINADSASARTFYIDNIRTDSPVPEPASLAVLGLGVFAALRRRR